MQPYKRWNTNQLTREINRLRRMKASTKDAEEVEYYQQQIEKIAAEIRARVNQHDEQQ